MFFYMGEDSFFFKERTVFLVRSGQFFYKGSGFLFIE